MRIHSKSATILFYGPERETCLGLIIPGEKTEVEVSGMDINFVVSQDITYSSFVSRFVEGLQDASGEFTGYLEKDGCDHGAHPDGAPGT
jgi:hypothetical protein